MEESNTKKCNICKLYLDLTLFKSNKKGDKLKACKDCNQKRLQSRVNNTCIHNKRRSKCELCNNEECEINAFRPTFGGDSSYSEMERAISVNGMDKLIILLTKIDKKLDILCSKVSSNKKDLKDVKEIKQKFTLENTVTDNNETDD